MGKLALVFNRVEYHGDWVERNLTEAFNVRIDALSIGMAKSIVEPLSLVKMARCGGS